MGAEQGAASAGRGRVHTRGMGAAGGWWGGGGGRGRCERKGEEGVRWGGEGGKGEGVDFACFLKGCVCRVCVCLCVSWKGAVFRLRVRGASVSEGRSRLVIFLAVTSSTRCWGKKRLETFTLTDLQKVLSTEA